jgi:TIR domain
LQLPDGSNRLRSEGHQAEGTLADIFISYTHRDRELARKIAETLQLAGATVWWDRELIAGDDFDHSILEQLKAAGCVIVIWTEASVLSAYVRDEAQTGVKEKKLIPLAAAGVDPPLGFGRFHTIQMGSDVSGDADWFQSLRLAVEERLGRALQPRSLPAEQTKEEAPASETAASTAVAVDLGDEFKTIGITEDCAWIASEIALEVRDLRDGRRLGFAKNTVDYIFPSGQENVCFCVTNGMGYQSPDTIRLEKWELAGSIEAVRQKKRDAMEYRPSVAWDSSAASVIERAQRDSIRAENPFWTYSWGTCPVAYARESECFAIVVNDPQYRIQVWRVGQKREEAASIPLGECRPDKMVFLPGAEQVAILDYDGKRDVYSISLWEIAAGKRAAMFELEDLTINTMCAGSNAAEIVLGLDHSLAILNLSRRAIERRIELDSRPVRSCVFEGASGRVAVLTDAEMLIVELTSGEVTWRLRHGYSSGVDCDFRGDKVFALLGNDKGGTALAVWTTASE